MYFYFILIFLSLLIIVDNFKINSKIRSKKIPIKASLDGIELGLLTLGGGLLLDNTVSKPSLDKLKENNITLYNQGMTKVYKNLLFLGPIYYLGVEKFIINDHASPISLYETMGIVLVHSFGYYFAHRSMHRNDFFKKYHYFHHQFNETLVPSIGNAVSENEFTFAYMFPFVVGSLMVNPNINSFNMGIMIVSIFNLLIHCQEKIY